MKERYQRVLDYLLEYAPVNILYRVKREILHEREDTAEMTALQETICNLPKVKKAFACQDERGFFGKTLHGVYFDGFDSTVELLKKNGVAQTDPHFEKAREALLHWTDYENDHFYKAGNAMDEHGRGGFRASWAEQLLELGVDETHRVRFRSAHGSSDAIRPHQALKAVLPRSHEIRLAHARPWRFPLYKNGRFRNRSNAEVLLLPFRNADLFAQRRSF